MIKSPLTIVFYFVIVVLGGASFGGCSALKQTSSSSKALTPAKLTVLAVTESYLSATVNGNTSKLDKLILWGEYGSDLTDVTKSRRAILNQVQAIGVLNKSTRVSPFTNFQVENVDVDQNEAEVNLVREGEELEIDLRWTGRNWMIQNDNIFGEYGYLARYLRQQS